MSRGVKLRVSNVSDMILSLKSINEMLLECAREQHAWLCMIFRRILTGDHRACLMFSCSPS